LIGQYQQNGQEWQPSGEPEQVNTYDFPKPEVGKGIPYAYIPLYGRWGFRGNIFLLHE
jgi:Rhodopirellula transposase DDE domain